MGIIVKSGIENVFYKCTSHIERMASMKKLRNINWYYLMGTLPFVLAITFMSAILLQAVWQKAAAAVIGIWIMILVFRKFQYLPRPIKDYGDMEPYDLRLPDDFHVTTFLCSQMDQYDFIKRNVEIISPLVRRRNAALKIALSPRFIKGEGDEFMRIAVLREIIRYKQGAQVKVLLGFVTPILLMVTLLEAYLVFGFTHRYPIGEGVVNFLGPILIAAVSICLALVWNQYVSSVDYQVDHELKDYASKDDIAAYIQRWDELLLPDEPELINEKSRQLEQYYIKKRLERL